MNNTSSLIGDIIRQEVASISNDPNPVMITFDLKQSKDIDMEEAIFQYAETVTNCSCSASCGSNYSRNGSCPCSTSCGSNYSR